MWIWKAGLWGEAAARGEEEGAGVPGGGGGGGGGEGGHEEERVEGWPRWHHAAEQRRGAGEGRGLIWGRRKRGEELRNFGSGKRWRALGEGNNVISRVG